MSGGNTSGGGGGMNSLLGDIFGTGPTSHTGDMYARNSCIAISKSVSIHCLRYLGV